MSGEKLPDVEGWGPRVLRLSAFTQTPTLAAEQNWWQEVVGEAPEESNRKRTERVDVGMVDGRHLSLRITQFKVDLIVRPRIQPEDLLDDPAPPLLGPLTENCEWFTKRAEAWFRCAGVPPIVRLAFGAKLSRPVENHDTGYRLLDQYLPSVTISPESSDFFYRINRRRPSQSISGLSVNRLTEWGVSSHTVQGAVLTGDPEPVPVIETPEKLTCFLHLDMNTDRYRKEPLPATDLPRLFRELVDLGVEIARDGDVR